MYPNNLRKTDLSFLANNEEEWSKPLLIGSDLSTPLHIEGHKEEIASNSQLPISFG